MKNKFAGYQVQMNELMMRVTDQLNTLDFMRKETKRRMKWEPKEGRSTDERIDKLPVFPLFSGTEPTPRDECGIEKISFSG